MGPSEPAPFLDDGSVLFCLSNGTAFSLLQVTVGPVFRESEGGVNRYSYTSF